MQKLRKTRLYFQLLLSLEFSLLVPMFFQEPELGKPLIRPENTALPAISDDVFQFLAILLQAIFLLPQDFFLALPSLVFVE